LVAALFQHFDPFLAQPRLGIGKLLGLSGLTVSQKAWWDILRNRPAVFASAHVRFFLFCLRPKYFGCARDN